MVEKKRIALVAHDNRKQALVEWVEWNYSYLQHQHLICTGTTGKLVEKAMKKMMPATESLDNKIKILRSGPLGGDQQLGALIAEGQVDMVIFLWDPMQPQPHDVDVKALMRIAVLYNVPIANNRATADYLMASALLQSGYKPIVSNYGDYINRNLNK